MRPIFRLALFAVIVGLLAIGGALAQNAGVKRTVLQRTDVAQTPPQESVFGTAEIAAGSAIGKHRHPGVEMGYVAAGKIELTVEGESPRRVKAGESYRVEAGKAHDARNVGAAPALAVATWVVEKGKPLAEPVN